MSKRKILLVDDSPTVLALHQRILGSRSYDLVLAHNGKEAVEKACAEPPDLVLMDVVMPVMDGIAACRAMRENAAMRQTPIIMMTTRGERVNVEAGYAAGCTEYMTKPCNGLELLSMLRNHLGD